jgi:ATP-binding cassette subfamily B protein
VIELGTHDELMKLGGRYHRMFTLQAERFASGGDVEAGAEGDAPTYEVLS